jgi:hypothetical protein
MHFSGSRRHKGSSSPMLTPLPETLGHWNQKYQSAIWIGSRDEKRVWNGEIKKRSSASALKEVPALSRISERRWKWKKYPVQFNSGQVTEGKCGALYSLVRVELRVSWFTDCNEIGKLALGLTRLVLVHFACYGLQYSLGLTVLLVIRHSW